MNPCLNLKEVEAALNAIDKKHETYHIDDKMANKELKVLLEEFDSLGIPPVIGSSDKEIFAKVIRNSLLLVKLHRKSISRITDTKFEGTVKDKKVHDLVEKCEKYKTEIQLLSQKLDTERNNLQNMCASFQEQVKKLAMKEKEFDCYKRYHASKCKEWEHKLREQGNYIHKLETRISNQEKHMSGDDVLADYLRKCKSNENIYKETIISLQQNNDRLLNELLQLREENTLLTLDKVPSIE